MHRISLGACALAVAIALPSLTVAAPRSGGYPAAGGAVRTTEPVFRAAPPAAAAPQARPAPPAGGGFNFNRDIAPPARPAPAAPPPVARFAPPARPAPVAPQPNRPAPAYRRAPNTNASGGQYQGRFIGPIVRNPHAPGGTWGWNHGVAWRPAPVYWGGGFWGAFALAALSDALLFGSVIDDQDQLIYPSYQIQPDTPGWDLLQDYELQQTPCGPPNLVVIWGPDNSVICAVPNDQVGPGNYQVDPSTFTLVPAQ